MNVNVEDISSVKKKVKIEIPVEEVTREVDSFYDELRKKAKIKGFRPGKAPRNVLENYFRDYVKAEVTQKLIQETYPAAVSETHLHPVSEPAIEPGELGYGKSFQYSAVIEIKPDIKIEGYIGLSIHGEKEGAKEEEVSERLKELQTLHANLKTITEARSIQKGDYVIIDYDSKMYDKPLEEGKAIDYTVEVGSGQFIPAIEEKLIGLKQEDESEIEVPFPEDYGYAKWAGKTISFHVKIKEIKEKILPPLDDEFAKDIGDYPSLEELRLKLKTDIEGVKELVLKRQLKDQIMDQLIQATPFEVPETLVQGQTKALVSDTKLRLATQGMALKNLGVSEEKIQEDYKEIAKRQVQTFLILEKIASQEGITVSDEEAEDHLKEIAERAHQKFEVVKRHYEKNELIPDLKAKILSDKTLDFLLEKSKVTPV
jgi:trigger factor